MSGGISMRHVYL